MKRIRRKRTTVYHCMTRAVAGEMLLEKEAKDVLRGMLWKVAGFCGVEVLAYCVMTNHFHVLVRVPERDTEVLTRAEVLRRYRLLYEVSNVPGYPDADVMKAILEGDDEDLAQEWMERLAVRMNDVSQFMWILKNRLTKWFNKTHGRFGTLWAERFKSVVVQDQPDVLRTVAAYLDLNPVRAGLVEDPALYRWCSYADAMGGKEEACGGLSKVMGVKSWSDGVAGYRVILFGKGGVVRRKGEGMIPAERVRAVLERGGKVELSELLRCRQRLLTEGVIVGTPEFVREVGAEQFRAEELTEVEGGEASGILLSRSEKQLGELPQIEGIECVVASWREV